SLLLAPSFCFERSCCSNDGGACGAQPSRQHNQQGRVRNMQQPHRQGAAPCVRQQHPRIARSRKRRSCCASIEAEDLYDAPVQDGEIHDGKIQDRQMQCDKTTASGSFLLGRASVQIRAAHLLDRKALGGAIRHK
ncbi:MAG TPA: hypothetical protein VFR21_12725, partial [Bradyrhizobium sp.]|nr:hypothetical protein [Bradyrhizobium sp.]